jgi:hypothetical protein
VKRPDWQTVQCPKCLAPPFEPCWPLNAAGRKTDPGAIRRTPHVERELFARGLEGSRRAAP